MPQLEPYMQRDTLESTGETQWKIQLKAKVRANRLTFPNQAKVFFETWCFWGDLHAVVS